MRFVCRARIFSSAFERDVPRIVEDINQLETFLDHVVIATGGS